ncbi:MAG: nucleoside deaminase, partial [Planctomycetota bacterium]
MIDLDQHWMARALELAYQAEMQEEVPVGAILVHNGQIIGAAHNQRETLDDPTAHAEMIAITQAAAAIGDWRLEDTTLYVTLEP